MGKEEISQNERKTTRSSSAVTTPDSKAPALVSKTSDKSKALSINSLGFSNESLSLNDLLNLYPGRRKQVLDLLNLIGPLTSPMFPLFVYGSASTGKTDVTLNIFKHLRRPFVYCSCITSYSPRTMFESVLNQLLLHRKSETNGYLSAKRCEKMSDFVNLMREALNSVVDSLKGKSGNKNSPSSQMNGTMVYLIFDDIERVREWEKDANSLAVLFNLHHLLKMREVGFIFISRKSRDTFESDTGYEDPLPVHFPDYSEDDLRQILMRNQASPKLYSSFLDVVLRPFCRVTRRIDELCAAFSPLFDKYCEPLGYLESVPGEDKRKLYAHIQPYITLFLNETSNPPRPLVKPSPNKDSDAMKNYIINKKQGSTGNIDEVDFHMSTSAKYLLISAFLASRNPATLDASLFDSTGGSDNRKRKRKSSEKSMEKKETKEQELLMKGPGTFPLERLLAVFQCITDGEEQGNKEDDCNLGSENLMSNILLQLSSLCSANFITRGGSCCPLEGSVRYRSTVSEDIALKVARSLKFPLSKYMYR